MTKAQSMLDKIKQMFEAMPPTNTPPPATTPPAPVTVKLSDGTEAVVDKFEVGGVMKVGEALVVPGDYTTETGDVVTIGDNGVIAAIVPKKVEEAPIDMTTPAGIANAYEKFASGTMDVPGMGLILKALMEYCFGWQIREQQDKATRDAAIAVYTEGLKNAQQTITQQETMMKEMFTLMEQLVSAPGDDAPVDSTKKKFSFSKIEGKNAYFNKMSEAMKTLKEKQEKLKIA